MTSYFDVLPKDILNLTAEYKGPNVIVEERKTGYGITILTDQLEYTFNIFPKEEFQRLSFATLLVPSNLIVEVPQGNETLDFTSQKGPLVIGPEFTDFRLFLKDELKYKLLRAFIDITGEDTKISKSHRDLVQNEMEPIITITRKVGDFDETLAHVTIETEYLAFSAKFDTVNLRHLITATSNGTSVEAVIGRNVQWQLIKLIFKDDKLTLEAGKKNTFKFKDQVKQMLIKKLEDFMKQ